MPSSAIMEMIGLPSSAYSASTACAMAFMPLVTDNPTGNPIVTMGS